MTPAKFFGPSLWELGIIAIVGLLGLVPLVLASVLVFVTVNQQSGKKTRQPLKEREFAE